MCGRFTVLTREEVADAVRAVQERGLLKPLAGSRADRAQARPASTVEAFGIRFQPEPLTWGFSFEWHKGPVFNTRIESLLTNTPTWREAARDGRCIVPVATFFEPHGTETAISPRTGRPIKRPYEFEDVRGTALLLAGVSAQGACSIVTTQPNSQVAPVHDRMPLVLSPAEAADWVDGSWTDAQLRELWQQLADRSHVRLTVAPEVLAGPQRAAQSGADEQLSLF